MTTRGISRGRAGAIVRFGAAAALCACSGDEGRTSASTTGVGSASVTGNSSTSEGSSGSSGGGSSGSGSASETGTGADSTSTSGGTTTSSTSGGTTSGDSTTGVSVTEGSTGTSTTGPAGCKQVDFLFVIDNSVSMENEQSQLTAAFPAFIDTIKNTLPTNDYHVMVVDTDDTGRCSPSMCSHSTCQAAGKYACMDIFSACDTTRGAGVVHPAGEFASNMPCDFEPGKRFLLASDPDLTANFTCAAKVGTAGNPSERPMDAMVEAVSPSLEGPGGCNEGFLRENAILVVTFISDDPNVEDQNTAQETFDALVAAKGGDVDKIVMLGLIPGMGCGSGGKHWAQLISLFGAQGIQGPVCSMDYNAFFQDAVGTILDACVINPG